MRDNDLFAMPQAHDAPFQARSTAQIDAAERPAREAPRAPVLLRNLLPMPQDHDAPSQARSTAQIDAAERPARETEERRRESKRKAEPQTKREPPARVKREAVEIDAAERSAHASMERSRQSSRPAELQTKREPPARAKQEVAQIHAAERSARASEERSRVSPHLAPKRNSDLQSDHEPPARVPRKMKVEPVDDEVRGLVEAFVAEELAPCEPGDVPTGRRDIAQKAAAYLKAKDSTASHRQVLTALSDILATPEKEWRHGKGTERVHFSVFAYRDGDSRGKMCRWKGPSQHV